MVKRIYLIALAVLLLAIVAVPAAESGEAFFDRVRANTTPAPTATPAPDPVPAAVPIEGAVVTPKPEEPAETPAPAPTPADTPEGFVFATETDQNYGDTMAFEALTTVAPAATHAPVRFNALYSGIRDDKETSDVRICQERLIELGYLTVKADGGYGEKTEKAVRDFQNANGIEETGVADNDTLTLLYSDRALAKGEAPEGAAAPRMETLKKGSKSDDVRKFQSKMIEYGFLGGKADGIYGDDTVEGVKTLEQYYIDVDNAYALAHPTPIPAPTPVTTYRPAPTPAPKEPTGEVNEVLFDRFMADGDIPTVADTDYHAGDNNMDIRRLQNRLVTLGYMRTSDGDFGDATVNALLYFQKKNGLEETGDADITTQTALYASTSVKSDVIVMPYYIKVDVGQQRVMIYEWDGTGFRKKVKEMVCSTGKKETPTPLGTFNKETGPLERWHCFSEFHSYAQYAWNITDEVFFHSVLFNKMNDNSSIQYGTVQKLGHPASHGCIRLSVEDAKWIYEHCPVGVTVEIYGTLPSK